MTALVSAAADRHAMRVAAAQHGCVTTAQLRAAGLSRDAIAHRVRIGWMLRRHRGVFIVGPLVSPLTESSAALLACGAASALSYESAGARLVLRPEPAVVEVSVVGNVRARDGVRVHRVKHLDTIVVDGLRVTSPQRTLADLATRLSPHEHARITEEAQVERLIPLPSCSSTQPKLTRSEAERRLLELIRAAELPEPRTNTRVAGHEVDFHWPEHRLVVEVDGFQFHSTREAFERDRLRGARLQASGQRVMRITWRQIAATREAVAARLAAAMATP